MDMAPFSAELHRFMVPVISIQSAADAVGLAGALTHAAGAHLHS